MANLLESYKGRLAISEKFYAQQNGGAKMSNQKKLITAMCLQNESRFLNEAFQNSVGTQRADLGTFKKFVMDITTLTMPNLIINDIFAVKPMSSFSGYVTFMEFALGTEKGGAGGTAEVDPFGNAMAAYDQSRWDAQNVVNSPITGLGEVTEGRIRYTGSAVVETIAAGQTKLSWTPVLKAWLVGAGSQGEDVEITVGADGTLGSDVTENDKVKYIYDNQYIPQDKLPTLVGRMSGIALTARARRIAVYYSQMAAFQSKMDYGMDFESTIAQQAQAELQFEIDSEAVELVKKTADATITSPITWYDEELDTISYSMKAEGFLRAINQAKARFYKKTNKFMPNWMLVGAEVLPILYFVKDFAPAANAVVNGPYVAGTVSGMKVVVSPALGKECYLGVLGADGNTFTGLYAPYMPLVPTQLLGFADGTMSQGFSTLYDMKIVNPALLEKIKIENGDNLFLGRVEVIETSEI